MNTSFIKKISPIALAMVFFFTPFPACALTPIEVANLVASDGTTSDYFGYWVAVDGDTVVIGAFGDDDNGVSSGSAYVFSRSGSTWEQQAKLTASDRTTGDYFGYSVAVDGDTAVIGAPYDDDNGVSSGSAYVFSRSGSTWEQQAKFTASDGDQYDYFGRSVAVDGDTAVIGAFGDDDNGSSSGSAYVFSRSTSTWEQQYKLMASDGAPYDYFGRSVAVDGDTAVIGAYGDDDNGDNSGSVYVFSRNASTWEQQYKLMASDGAPYDYFGKSVAVDGYTAVIGAPYDDDNGTMVTNPARRMCLAAAPAPGSSKPSSRPPMAPRATVSAIGSQWTATPRQSVRLMMTTMVPYPARRMSLVYHTQTMMRTASQIVKTTVTLIRQTLTTINSVMPVMLPLIQELSLMLLSPNVSQLLKALPWPPPLVQTACLASSPATAVFSPKSLKQNMIMQTPKSTSILILIDLGMRWLSWMTMMSNSRERLPGARV
jgi:hypothetical protein